MTDQPNPGSPPPSRFEWPPEASVADVEPCCTDRVGHHRLGCPNANPVTLVLTALEELIDAPPITAPQAQGDVMILPWPPTTAPAWRGQEIDASAALPTAAVAVTPDGSHIAATDTLTPRARWTERRKGNALGTLVVPPGAVARLAHREHPDLLIGPGVYILQTQRRWQAPAAD